MLASLRQLTEMAPPLTGELEVLERTLTPAGTRRRFNRAFGGFHPVS